MNTDFRSAVFDFFYATYEHWPSLSIESAIAYDRARAEMLGQSLREVDPEAFDAIIAEILFAETSYVH